MGFTVTLIGWKRIMLDKTGAPPLPEDRMHTQTRARARTATDVYTLDKEQSEAAKCKHAHTHTAAHVICPGSVD